MLVVYMKSNFSVYNLGRNEEIPAATQITFTEEQLTNAVAFGEDSFEKWKR